MPLIPLMVMIHTYIHSVDGWFGQVAQGLEHGLPGASSIVDRTIPTFSRGELPHFAGINTFMKVRRYTK